MGKIRKVVHVVVPVLTSIVLSSVSTPAQQSKRKGGSISVTGCLNKGDEAGEFAITGTDGKTYGLRSSSVKLAEHMGHRVTVTGTLQKRESEKEERKEGRKEGKNEEAAHINVSKLEMLSTTCPP